MNFIEESDINLYHSPKIIKYHQKNSNSYDLNPKIASSMLEEAYELSKVKIAAF